MQSDFESSTTRSRSRWCFFQNQVQPISVVVMLDTSGSMTLTLDLLRAAAEQFVLRLLPADKARVGAFNDKIQFMGRSFMTTENQLVTDIKNLDYGNGTRLWDALCGQPRRIEGHRRPQGDSRVHRWRRYRKPLE